MRVYNAYIHEQLDICLYRPLKIHQRYQASFTFKCQTLKIYHFYNFIFHDITKNNVLVNKFVSSCNKILIFLIDFIC